MAITQAQWCTTWTKQTDRLYNFCFWHIILLLNHLFQSILNDSSKFQRFAAYYGESETCLADIHFSCWHGLARAGHCGTGSHATLGCALNFQVHGHCGCAGRASALPRRSTLGAHFPRMSTEHGWTLGNSFRKLGLLLIVRTRDKRLMTLRVMPWLRICCSWRHQTSHKN